MGVDARFRLEFVSRLSLTRDALRLCDLRFVRFLLCSVPHCENMHIYSRFRGLSAFRASLHLEFPGAPILSMV